MNIMEFFKMDSDDTDIQSLQDVLLDSLRDLYSAENQLLKALPKIEKAASDRKLQHAIRTHLSETERHVQRLEEIAKLIGKKLSGKHCKAMEGLIKEGEEATKHESSNPALIDALIIGAAQRVEHYEMAGYGTARAFAEQLGESRVVKLLQQTLNEEGATDKKLTEISESSVLPSAFEGVRARMNQSEDQAKARSRSALSKGRTSKQQASGKASSAGKNGRSNGAIVAKPASRRRSSRQEARS